MPQRARRKQMRALRSRTKLVPDSDVITLMKLRNRDEKLITKKTEPSTLPAVTRKSITIKKRNPKSIIDNTQQKPVTKTLAENQNTAIVKSTKLSKSYKKRANARKVQSLDPYDFTQFEDDDEKENIDPKGKPDCKVTSKDNVSKPKPVVLLKRIGSPKPKASKHLRSDCTKSGSLPPGPSLAPTPKPMSPPNQPSPPTVQSSASSTIYLPLPRMSVITTAPLLSATPTTTHIHLSSTPSVPTVSRPAELLPTFSSLTPIATASPMVLTKVRLNQTPVEVQRDPEPQVFEQSSTQHESGKSSRTDQGEGSSSKDLSGGSLSSGERRRRRRLTESQREEAYKSWLDDFNAQLEKFESHNLTVVEGEPDKST